MKVSDVQYAVRDILRQDLIGFDVSVDTGTGDVMVSHHLFLARIKFRDGNMLMVLDYYWGVEKENHRNKVIPLSDPKCFEDVKTVVLDWFGK